MRIGVPKEIKPQEYRVGLVPASVRELVRHGHCVWVEHDAGAGIGITDTDYIKAGANIGKTADEIFRNAELIIKVKEPQPEECLKLHEEHTLFTYLHLAPDANQTNLLMASGCTAIAYETVTQESGGLPLLAPMSQVAGRMSIQAGAHCLEKAQGGSGILLGGVPGMAAAQVLIIGGGVVGTNAARMAMGLEARVIVLDTSLQRLRELDFQFGSKITTIFSTTDSIDELISDADLVIGGVLTAGSAAPTLVRKEHLSSMRKGSVLLDVSIDQGGCFETSRPTTHQDPTYIVDNIVHYCVANMPGGVPRTSTFALNNATLPFVLALADKGIMPALLSDPHLLNGLNVHRGKLTYKAVADALSLPYTPAKTALN